MSGAGRVPLGAVVLLVLGWALVLLLALRIAAHRRSR